MNSTPSELLRRLPHDLGTSIWKTYRAESKKNFGCGEDWLVNVMHDHDVERWPINTEDWEPWGKCRVAACMTILEFNIDPSTAAERIQDYAERFGILIRAKKPESIIRRAMHIDWWRKRGRSAYSRASEKIAINLGLVTHYVSDSGLALRREQKSRNRRILSSMQVVNEDNFAISLADAHDRSVSNPAVRRAELMVRIKGMEEIALERGMPGLFMTITAPSVYHRKSGRWSGVTPHITQKYLKTLWARIRAALKRQGCNYFGIRVAEPHKDGTPHWHLLCWCAPEHQDVLTRIARNHAMAEAPDEPGALEHRFKVEYMRTGIDPETGRAFSAISYIAKYISKNVDGHGINEIYDTTSESKDGLNLTPKDEAVERIEAWARVWGIRQFQQFGSAPVTAWRELRRIRIPIENNSVNRNEFVNVSEFSIENQFSNVNAFPIEKSALIEAHAAADCGDWATYIKINENTKVTLEKTLTGVVNSYGELAPPSIVGVRCGTRWMESRVHIWRLERIAGNPKVNPSAALRN